MSFIFGLTGSTFFVDIGASISNNFEEGTELLGVIGALLILGGLSFKIASFPFHTWVPDVYQTAPITTVAYLSVASKAVGFGLMIRFFYVVFGDQLNMINWSTIIICLSLASMVYGNFDGEVVTEEKVCNPIGIYGALKFSGEKSELIIGNNNTFREGVTVNPGTKNGGMITRIENDCFVPGSKKRIASRS